MLTEGENKQIGLALSGGGFRATLFHLGVIKYLKDNGLLCNVSHIVSVSGGTVLAAHLVLNWEEYTGSAQSFKAVTDSLIDFVKSDVRGKVTRRLLSWPFFRDSGRLIRQYYRGLYSDRLVNDLSPSSDLRKPELHMLATNLTRGCLSSFSNNGFFVDALADASPVSGTLLPIDLAVAASSAFPVFFPPVRIDNQLLGVPGDIFTPSPQYLTDGGVYDNAGISKLLRLQTSTPFDSLIFSDAAGQLDWNTGKIGFLTGAVRTVDILMRRVSDLERENLTDDTCVPRHIISIRTKVPTQDGAVRAELQQLLPKIRTDLDSFNDVEIDSLVRHGYSAARNVLIKAGMTEDLPASAWSPSRTQRTVDQQREHLSSDKKKLSNASRVLGRMFSWRDPITYAHIFVSLILGSYLLHVGSSQFAERTRGPFNGKQWDYTEVADHIAGPAESNDVQGFKRGFMNNILSMAFEPMPISNNAGTNNKISIRKHITCWIQGKSKLVKLQMFDIPEGAQQVRARSQATVDEGPDYVAHTWVIIKNRAGVLRELVQTRPDKWLILPEDAGGIFYVVAVYDVAFLEQPGDYSGAEIDDLAGNIESVQMLLGGKFEKLSMQEVWDFPPNVPLTFYQYSDEAVKDIPSVHETIKNAFSELMTYFNQQTIPMLSQRNAVGTVLKKRKDALAVWKEHLDDPQEKWLGFELNNVQHDFIFRFTGKR